VKILLTGGTGFLGKILKKKLEASHEVITLGRQVQNQISVDLSKNGTKLPPVDMIIHAAGKAHVIPKSESEKQEFWEVNLNGTANLLQSIKSLPQIFIFISTVAVYGLEEGTDITESSALLGDTPYAKSKIEAENLVRKWGEENQVKVLILRLPLLVGVNPPGNLGAMIKSIRGGFYRRLGEGAARKSMVLVEDLALALPDWCDQSGTYNLTDGNHPTMAELDTQLAALLGKKIKSIPIWTLRILAKIGDLIPVFPINSYRMNKLSTHLTFSDKKAQTELNWSPRPVLKNLDSIL